MTYSHLSMAFPAILSLPNTIPGFSVCVESKRRIMLTYLPAPSHEVQWVSLEVPFSSNDASQLVRSNNITVLIGITATTA